MELYGLYFLLIAACIGVVASFWYTRYRRPPNVAAMGTLKLRALGDRLIIAEDKFRTGYECSVCEGAGKLICRDCEGTGHSQLNKEITCKSCQGETTITCEACGGKGGLLIAPETAQRRPTTGKIISVGSRVKTLKVNDSVLYSNFAGYVIDTNGQVLRILHEPEVLSWIEGHLTVRRGARELPDSFDSSNSVALDKAVS